MSGEKNHEATPGKLQRLRRQGQLPLSADFRSTLVFVGAVGLLISGLPAGLRTLGLRYDAGLNRATEVRRDFFEATSAAQCSQVAHWLAAAGKDLLALTLPVFLVVTLLAVAGGYLQTGGAVSTANLAPRFERLNPAAGLKRLFFSRRAWISHAIALAKSLLLVWLVITLVRSAGVDIARLRPTDLPALGALTLRLLNTLLQKSAGLLLLLAAADLLLQRQLFFAEQRMSRDELLQEIKQMEGDPMMKQVRKALGREIVEMDIPKAVARCDVIINNPTHLSVGVRWSRHKEDLSWVLLKGVDTRARRIREAARMAGVPMIENISLARALFRLKERERISKPFAVAMRELLRWLAEREQGKVNATDTPPNR